ncbi:MAG TPA: FeoA family protein [Thermoanaerobaculia bacterium]|nr:FeoA family protein [Thermoanaerobaculia bacterium]
MNTYECPLCGTDFEGASCHSTCPLAKGCMMVRCPNCAYEFVESGRIADMLRRWIRRAPKCAVQDDGTVPITELPIGTTALIASIAPTSAARLNRLASYGIVPGTELRLVARRPAVVVQCGSASVALEDEIAREIFVAAAP